MTDISDFGLLSECLDYNPITGCFIWKTRPPSHFAATPKRTAQYLSSHWNGRFAGKVAGTKNKTNGYCYIAVSGRMFVSHRIAWLLQKGEWPKADIDHINGDRSDNRISNLRDVSRVVNSQNAGLRKSNTSGVCGVSWTKARNKWTAAITNNRRVKNLGFFDSFDEAVAARRKAEAALGFHQNHGKRPCYGNGKAGQ